MVRCIGKSVRHALQDHGKGLEQKSGLRIMRDCVKTSRRKSCMPALALSNHKKFHVYEPHTRILGHFPVSSEIQNGSWVTCLPDSECMETNLHFEICRMSFRRARKLKNSRLKNTFPKPCALLCAHFYTNIDPSVGVIGA